MKQIAEQEPFAYAFKRHERTKPGEEFIFLTLNEFDIFFSQSAPIVAQKALAYSTFTVAGQQLTRVPLPNQPSEGE